MAYQIAKLSYAKRRRVGCVIVKIHNISTGYNGTPHGFDNGCEEDQIKAIENENHTESTRRKGYTLVMMHVVLKR